MNFWANIFPYSM